jgi:peptidoglycan/LPS O-acetylase OafA/YrhL
MKAFSAARDLRIDVLKLLCAQCIVLHHFSAYGPVSQALEVAAPAVSRWLYDYGRMAVQVFLVLGGYLAAGALERAFQAKRSSLGAMVFKRYLRLALPLLAALVLVSLTASAVRVWMSDAYLPGAPTWVQAASHVLLLQDVLGIEALSVGVWYVAIDFQLYVVMALMGWVGHRLAWGHATRMGVGALLVASLFVVNRDVHWDAWAPYFFGAYGMGALVFWTQRSTHRRWWLAGLALLVGAALVVDFRERLVLAWVTALVLAVPMGAALQSPPRIARWVAQLGQSSYALFLVHFAVLMLVNLGFSQLDGVGAEAAMFALVLGAVLSTALGIVFARWVEAPLSRWVERR